MKVTNKSLLINIEESTTVGDLKVTFVAQVIGTPKQYDVEFCDVIDITFRDTPIDGYSNWKKFREFHKEIGIDFDKILEAEFDRIFTRAAVQAIVLKDLKKGW
jgi:hypothetical protein